MKQQLLLLVHSAVDGSAPNAACDNSSSSSRGSCRGGSVGSCVYAAARLLLELPAAGSAEQQLLEVLHRGGAQFLHEQYAAAEPDGQKLLLWIRSKLGVQRLSHSRAVDFILQAHAAGSTCDTLASTSLVDEALYVALHGTQQQHTRAVADLFVWKVDPDGGSVACYYPEAGHDWQLQQVLPPSEVAYLHPAYVDKIDALSSSRADMRSKGNVFKHFITHHFGVLTFPQPGSADLRRAAATPDRWLPLLLLLRERWSDYSLEQQQQLSQDLKHMKVDSSSGPQCLQDCFLQGGELQEGLLKLLQQLQLPFLQVPQPSSRQWLFLQDLGVSMQLQWPDIHKALLQLSSSNAAPELGTMHKMYKRVHALCEVDATGRTAGTARLAFEQQKLLFVPQQEGQPGHQWLHSRCVLWDGNREIFAHMSDMIFISGEYKVRCLTLLLLPLARCQKFGLMPCFCTPLMHVVKI